MLTHDDATVDDAAGVLAGLRDSGLRYVGFKDVGQPTRVLREVAAMAHDAGMDVMLEVVSVSVEDELRSLRAAARIDVDWVLGGTHADEGAQLLGDVRLVAGSIATLEQIAAVEAAGAWGFTIGGAIFEGRLPGGPGVAGQVEAVLGAGVRP